MQTCPDDCSGVGLCVRGKCVCTEGWFGIKCERKRCPADCSGAGYCFEGKCQCITGFCGEACESVHPQRQSVAVKLIKDEPMMARRGVSRFLNAASLRPLERPTCPDNCNSRGSCTITGTCVCKAGYSGGACETFCPNECSQQGQCIDGACLCFAGFLGADCSVKSCCSGHGTCDQPGTCVCQPGWGGEDCSVSLVCPDPTCSGHGTCERGRCVCKDGFLGLSCEQPTCPNCGAHGSCHEETGECICEEGFFGRDCSTQLLTCVNDCSGHGLCLNGQCMCGNGWSGSDCSRPAQ